MKNKILLGLAAITLLGAVSYGASGPDPDTGMSTIDITTTANIIGYGMVISDAAVGANPVNVDVTLTHTSVYAPDSSYTSPSNSVTRYLRRSDNASLAAGQVVEIHLYSDGTNNNNLSDGSNSIPHTLTATMDSTAFNASGAVLSGTEAATGVLTVTGTTYTDDVTYTVGTGGIASIPFTFESNIAAGGFWDSSLNAGAGGSKPAGTYTNVSTFTAQVDQLD